MSYLTCPVEECNRKIRGVHDTMDLLSGKWKISIVASLCYHNSRRFSDLLKDVNGISNKMLSKELKELELNKLVTRRVENTQPIAVTYQLTDYGLKLQKVIENLSEWGIEHRKFILGI